MYLLHNNKKIRIAPDIRLAGYQVLFAGYPVGRIAEYPEKLNMVYSFFKT